MISGYKFSSSAEKNNHFLTRRQYTVNQAEAQFQFFTQLRNNCIISYAFHFCLITFEMGIIIVLFHWIIVKKKFGKCMQSAYHSSGHIRSTQYTWLLTKVLVPKSYRTPGKKLGLPRGSLLFKK